MQMVFPHPSKEMMAMTDDMRKAGKALERFLRAIAIEDRIAAERKLSEIFEEKTDVIFGDRPVDG